MKKILLLIFAVGFAFLTFAQPVSDNAIIPVSVSLSGILRLNVTSGGNIEFQVNTLDQYTNGISNGPQYDTYFTVASSTDFNVMMSTEDANLIGGDDATGANTMDLANVEYTIDENGGGAEPTNWVFNTGTPPGTATELVQASTAIVTGVATLSAGDINQNAFIIHWALNDTDPATVGTLLSQNLASDRYSTNVFLTVVGK